MNVQQARDTIKELNNFITLVETFEVTSLETEAIYEYALDNSVSRVASKLNEKGYTVPSATGKRKLISNDVSNILNGNPTNELHVIIKKMFNSNKNKVNKRYN